MRTFLSLLLCAGLSFAVSAAETPAPGPAHPRGLVYPELDFHVPAAQRTVLKNGMVVYLVEDHSVPYISVQAYVRGGSAYEPAGKSGIAMLTAQSMLSGGTAKYPAEEMTRRLEILAASLDSSSGKDVAQASLWTLKRVSDETLDMFFSMLREPAFEEGKVEIERQKMLDAVRRQGDSPRELTPREFARLVYGAHPYANPESGSAEGLAGASLAGMRAFHARHYQPRNVILAVAGDLRKADFLKTLEKLTRGWKNAGEALPALPAVPEQPFKPGIYYLEKPLTQTNLRMGHLGLRLDDPNYFAVQVMNSILGGGLSFSSRLVSRIRTQEGLAYSVGSRFADLSGRGMFFAATQTRAEKTHYAVKLMVEEIERMRGEPVSAEELQGAKDKMINSLPFTFDTAEKAAQAFAELDYHGLPADYYDHYIANVRKVGVEDVRRAAKDYIHPDNWVLLVVGNEKAFDDPLSEWGGEVTRIEAGDAAAEGHAPLEL